jgi:hypothetical protein
MMLYLLHFSSVPFARSRSYNRTTFEINWPGKVVICYTGEISWFSCLDFPTWKRK